jgi:hypothetical protein
VEIIERDTPEIEWHTLIECWECGATLGISVGDLAPEKNDEIDRNSGYSATVVCEVCRATNDVRVPQRVLRWVHNKWVEARIAARNLALQNKKQ